jgi:hypothetical protein
MFQIPLAGNKNSEQNMQPSRQGSAVILTSSPYKNKLQEGRKRKKAIDQRKSSSKIRLQKKRESGPSNAHVSVICGEHGINRAFIRRLRRLWGAQSRRNWYESSDTDVECLYCSGVYSTDRRGEKWIKCTKCYMWCHEERSDTDDRNTFLCFFCNTE